MSTAKKNTGGAGRCEYEPAMLVHRSADPHADQVTCHHIEEIDQLHREQAKHHTPEREPRKSAALTPSQVVRKLIRRYVRENAGERELPSWLEAAGND